MAKSPGQKLKLLYLEKILLERTDENHPMTLSELSEALAAYGITAERKSLYSTLNSCAISAWILWGRKPAATATMWAAACLNCRSLK